MTRRFCDACGRECMDGIHTIQFPCHIAEPRLRGYVDAEGNIVSGRLIPVELCNQCSNAVWQAAFTTVKKLKKKETP